MQEKFVLNFWFWRKIRQMTLVILTWFVYVFFTLTSFRITSNEQQLFELEFWRTFIHAWNSLPIWFLWSNSVCSYFCLSFKIAHLVNSSLLQKKSNFLQKCQSQQNHTFYHPKLQLFLQNSIRVIYWILPHFQHSF